MSLANTEEPQGVCVEMEIEQSLLGCGGGESIYKKLNDKANLYFRQVFQDSKLISLANFVGYKCLMTTLVL